MKLDKNKINEAINLIMYAILVIFAYLAGIILMIVFFWAWIPYMIFFYPANVIGDYAKQSEEMDGKNESK